jgi:RNA-directed DNA polymerase
MATKLVIEPIVEANFLDCSHGFRPGRSAHDAIRIIDREITFKGKHIVVDADITGFFDTIRQDILIELLSRRISDRRVLRLIRMWVEAGVMEEGRYIEANGLGTPQGGVITPRTQNIDSSSSRLYDIGGVKKSLTLCHKWLY